MKKLTFISLVSVLMIMGCEKGTGIDGFDPNTTSCTLNSSSLIGVYKMTAVTYQENVQSIPEDVFVNYEPCEKDDVLSIKPDGTLMISEGPTSCNPPNSNLTLNWSLSGNVLTITTTGFSITTQINEYKCNSFKLRFFNPDDQSLTITTYTRI